MKYLILLKLFCIFSLSKAKYPSFMPKCSLSDPKLSECLIKATETVRPHIINNEIAEMVPKVTPLFIPEIELTQGSQSANFKAIMKNVSLYGLENYKFTDVQFKVENGMAMSTYNLFFDNIYICGQYIVDGKILVTPLKGSGFFHANITDSGFTAELNLKTEKKADGLTYFVLAPSKYKVKIGNIIDYGIDGLFKDSEVLASAVQKVIKDNLDILVEEVTPAVDEVIKQLLDNYIFVRLVKYPLEVLYDP